MMADKPAWYMTTKEFADEVVQLLAELRYFQPDEAVNPQDIVSAFSAVSESFARGASVAGRRVHLAEGVIRK
jgi:hypothetical protein